MSRTAALFALLLIAPCVVAAYAALGALLYLATVTLPLHPIVTLAGCAAVITMTAIAVFADLPPRGPATTPPRE